MSILVIVHTVAAAAGLLSGAAALVLKKGSQRHRMAGRVFVPTMLVMALTAMPLAWTAGKVLDVCSAVLVCYLVLSSWNTVRAGNKSVDVALLVFAGCAVAGYLWVEWQASQTGVRRPDVPAGVGYAFALVVVAAMTGDCVRLYRPPGGVHRIVRHLWRMCFALFMASVSFFLSRAHLFPASVQDSGILSVLALAPMVLMLFWVIWLPVRQRRLADARQQV